MSAIQSLTIPTGAEARAVRAEQRAAMRERLFQRLDRDGSGGISRQEFLHVLQNLPGAGSSGHAGAQDRVAAIMTRLDADGDGQVSAGELDMAMSRREGTTPRADAAGPLGGLLGPLSAPASAHGAPAAAARYAQAVARRG